jgi:tetratricopeptide (TPR) repeat protein
MNLDSNLLELEHASLVRRLDDLERTYAFNHTLTQETAYDSLLRTRRADLHRRVAVAIEELFPDQLEQNAAMLALHYEQAGADDKAFSYALMAGDLARRAYAHQEALMFYDRALAASDRLNGAALQAQVRLVYAHRGNVFEVRGDFDDALDNYRKMIAHAQRIGDLTMEAEGMGLLLTTQGVIGSVPDAEQQFQRAIELAQRSGDQELIGRALWSFGLSLRFKDPTRAIEYLRQALDIARAANLRELAAFALVDLVIAMQFAGQWDQIIPYSQQALEEFRALDNRSMVANCLGMLSEAFYARGDSAQARRYAEEGVQISETIENPWGIGYNTWGLMGMDAEAGDFDGALARAKTVESVMVKIPIPLFQGLSRMMMAHIYAELNQLDRAKTLATEALEILRQLESQAWALWSQGTLARVLIERGELDQAHAILDPISLSAADVAPNIWAFGILAPAALELGLIEGRYNDGLAFSDALLHIASGEDLQAYAAETFYMRGLIYQKLGDLPQAHAHLERVRATAVRSQNNLVLWRVEEAFAELHAARGDQDQAQAAHQHAVRLVREIIGHIGDPALRESFLQRRDIQALLSV